MNVARHDIVIVGAGSGGFAAARTARALGADVALVDHGPLGGLCILRGCMPSKTLIASSDTAQDVRDAPDLGIKVGSIGVDFPHIMRRKRDIIAGFAQYRIDGIREFTLYEGRARFLSRTRLQVGEHALIEAEKFIVATGSIVTPPTLPGLAQTGYIDSDMALEVSQLPASLLVLGGGYVGTELGQFFARLGVKTTIVLRSPHLLSAEDHDIGHALTDYFRGEGIDVRTGTLIERVSSRDGKKVAHVLHQGAREEIEADEILYALGRVPDIAGLDLQRAGVRANVAAGIEVDQSLRTTNPHIFGVGDATGRFLLVHVAIYQGELAARNAVLNAAEPADYHLEKTHTVFSDPQVAVVGDTERDLQSTGVSYIKGVYDFAEHGKAICINKTKGFVKMLAAADTGRILGACVLSSHGSDLIHEMIVAMNYSATVFEFIKIPHLHPTMAEIWLYPAEEIVDKMSAVQIEQRPLRAQSAG